MHYIWKMPAFPCYINLPFVVIRYFGHAVFPKQNIGSGCCRRMCPINLPQLWLLKAKFNIEFPSFRSILLFWAKGC